MVYASLAQAVEFGYVVLFGGFAYGLCREIRRGVRSWKQKNNAG